MNNPGYKYMMDETSKYWKALDETWYRIGDSMNKLLDHKEKLRSAVGGFFQGPSQNTEERRAWQGIHTSC